MLEPDTVLAGKYVIVRPLESGGMGDVYEALQKDLSRPVAIKLLRQDVLGDPAMFLRFQREAEAAASLGHPNIVQILDFRNDPDEQPMLIMEKLEGRSLRDLLVEAKTLAPPRAAFIALQILSALAAAHDAKIVHRDVKPANVFIIKTFAVRDFVKVLDFGIAKLLDLGSAAPVLTDLGQVLGTASYMAPEQARGLKVDGRADLFAVGGILFEALSGRRPREIGAAGLIDVGRKPCLKLIEVAPSIDPALAKVIDRALSLDPNERFPTAEAMAKALAPFAPGELLGGFGRTAKMVPDTVPEPPATVAESGLAVSLAVTVTDHVVPEPVTTQVLQPLAMPPSPSGPPPPNPSSPFAMRSSQPSQQPPPRVSMPVSGSAPSSHGPMTPQTPPYGPPSQASQGSGITAIVFVVALVVLGAVGLAFLALR